MSVPVITFFNAKSGVGKTFLTYHLAWMFQDLGVKTLVADLDPQANLTASFLTEDRLEQRWCSEAVTTVSQAIRARVQGNSELVIPVLEEIEEQLFLLGSDMYLGQFEEAFSTSTPSFLTTFWQLLQEAAISEAAEIILMDLGSNLGAINHAALIAANYVIIPTTPDIFSWQGLQNTGTTLQRWRSEWQQLGIIPPDPMQLLGYVIIQPPIRLYLGTNSYSRWITQIMKTYHQTLLFESDYQPGLLKDEPHCLSLLTDHFLLKPIAKEAYKPLFHLKPADGALGSYEQVVPKVYLEYQQLAQKIAKRIGILSNPNRS
jgi:cellulose biosynthesis protein BcsQ